MIDKCETSVLICISCRKRAAEKPEAGKQQVFLEN